MGVADFYLLSDIVIEPILINVFYITFSSVACVGYRFVSRVVKSVEFITNFNLVLIDLAIIEYGKSTHYVIIIREKWVLFLQMGLVQVQVVKGRLRAILSIE